MDEYIRKAINKSKYIDANVKEENDGKIMKGERNILKVCLDVMR